jgi:PPOX class probable F420-dependent enzyme
MTDLGSGRYLSITSFRRDGSPVATPVWVVAHAGHLYVWTGSQTGKVKRVRNNPEVMLAACTARGTVTGPAQKATAAIVPAGEQPEVWGLLTAKYRMQLRAIVYFERAMGLLRRNPGGHGERVYLELTVTAT